MAEQRITTHTVFVAVGAGEIGAAPDFGAQFGEQLGRRHPFQLQAVVAVAFAEQHFIHQIVGGEIPSMRMLLVLVADAGTEAAAFERQAVIQRQGLEPGFFDSDLAIVQHGIEVTAKIRIDVGG